MVASGAPAGPTRPPQAIEDFLWNIHSVLVATTGPLPLDQLKDTYSKHFGHKCAIERFLVVGEGGLPATLKRIPHIVSLFMDNGVQCIKATLPADCTKQQLIDADAAYRRELAKKGAQAKAAAASSKNKAPGPAAGGAPGAAGAAGAAGAKAGASDGQAKRPAEGAAQEADAKRPRTDSTDAETLARMLVQGVVRVLQNRVKAGKGALPLGELEEEFKALWKVPFNLQQAGEKDAVSFLQKWPNKVEVATEGGQTLVLLPKKAAEKPKEGEGAAKAGAGASSSGATAAKTAPPTPGAAGKAPTAPPAAKAPPAPAVPPAPEAPPRAPAKAAAPEAQPPPAKNGQAVPKKAPGGPAPVRPPQTIEDFLWNIHCVIDAYGGPMPLDQLKDAYSKQLGHRCLIERFLVVGDGGLAATLKRIPHVVTVVQEKDGGLVTLKASLPSDATKETLIAADASYRKQLQQKAKAKQAPARAEPAAAAAPAAPPASASAVAPPPAAAAAPPAPAAPPAAPVLPPAGAAGTADGQAAKRARVEDAETLAKMLVQGVVRVLQNRQKEDKPPLPVSELAEEFKALWKVPFNLQQAGETDAISFLQKYPNKVEVNTVDSVHVVQLAKKVPAAAKGVPAATKGGPTLVPPAPPAKTGAPTAVKAGAPQPKAPAGGSTAAASTAAAQASDASPLLPSPASPAQQGQLNEELGKADQDASAAAASSADRGGALSSDAVDASAEAAEGFTLPEIQEQASSMLEAMRDMLRRQEVLVAALDRFGVQLSP